VPQAGRGVRLGGEFEQGAVMDASFIILWAVVGAIIGWLANQIMVKGGLGMQTDLLVGVAGAVIGGWLFSSVFGLLGGQQAVLLGHLVNSALGAVIATFVGRRVIKPQT
jgi:uncharacterized membrane protein YeaQ/YmgE (transglycosylase-associated protein family)